MGDIRLDPSEMDNLHSRLLRIGDSLESQPTLTAPGANAFGSTVLAETAAEFSSNEETRRTDCADWCQNNADGVQFTAQFVGQTDEDVAQAWYAQHLPTDPAYVPATPAHTFSWDKLFKHQDKYE
ncbi:MULTISPECIES: hypothetical protein [unclassified Actinobaculum]|uniref:hypothetical protein n=1 Tax=unclassified Actinobaculum TaxID=2609299 RepID=UPI000D5271A7|nr:MULTISPECIES: hypothetical protein [unclassified Actinobaculum]AWE43274.1 hypothetical protein DDD63_11535 [Actinobaculum sp. 313]RTE49834.1 hypothetical protein EKN07_04735 [Actinobaculum sp. 352]